MLRDSWVSSRSSSIVRDAIGTLSSNLGKAAAKLVSAGMVVANRKSIAANMETGENNSQHPQPRRAQRVHLPQPRPPRGATTRRPLHPQRTSPTAPSRTVIFVPGTGSYGGGVFAPNLRKLLSNVRYADPVWLNVPHAMLGDTQQNAEYIAYAINYVSGITNVRKDISLITWSQGGLGSQWPLAFWPSGRAKVANLLCVSVAAAVPGLLCDPATKQQNNDSQFVQALLRHGGGSAWVPTTSLYSALLDEMVQPQQQGASASARCARISRRPGSGSRT
ncbi:hypothetical protein PG993_012213 [Apiospora rasikravindrae]|uniref:Uncharacterized protein n=1 Tax=Apiospora rasikravindrae TaxID=990691 RepID=A0ABR1S1S2_9PEZI